MKRNVLFLLILVMAGLINMTLAQQSISLKIIETAKDGEASISFDDGEYENDSIDKLNDDDLDMGWEGEDLNIMTTFTRFQNVTIPQGASIDSAVLVIHAHEDESADALITVYAEDTDDSPLFTETEALADRTLTEASVAWDCTDDWTMWEPYQSPDLAAVIQEVIDRPGWQSGNSLTLFLMGKDQGASLLDNARDFESYENIEDPDDGGDGLHHPERIPTLNIYFSGTTSTKALETVDRGAAQISIYPNPADQGVLYISSDGSGLLHAYIYDVTGSVVNSSVNLTNKVTLDVSGLNDGFYLVKTIQDGASHIQKIIIR